MKESADKLNDVQFTQQFVQCFLTVFNFLFNQRVRPKDWPIFGMEERAVNFNQHFKRIERTPIVDEKKTLQETFQEMKHELQGSRFFF